MGQYRKIQGVEENWRLVVVCRCLAEHSNNRIHPISISLILTIFPKFDIMQVQVKMEFDQLLKIVRALPSGKLKQLKAEIEKNSKAETSKIDLESLLLHGPTATKKQLDTIMQNRKELNKWRTIE